MVLNAFRLTSMASETRSKISRLLTAERERHSEKTDTLYLASPITLKRAAAGTALDREGGVP